MTVNHSDKYVAHQTQERKGLWTKYTSSCVIDVNYFIEVTI